MLKNTEYDLNKSIQINIFIFIIKETMRTYWTRAVSKRRSAELNKQWDKDVAARKATKNISHDMTKVRLKRLTTNS